MGRGRNIIIRTEQILLQNGKQACKKRRRIVYANVIR